MNRIMDRNAGNQIFLCVATSGQEDDNQSGLKSLISSPIVSRLLGT